MMMMMIMFRIIARILLCVLVAESVPDLTNTSTTVNYVIPNRSTTCCMGTLDQHSCLTLNEYANKSEMFFVSNSAFYFCLGSHQLSVELCLQEVHGIYFIGLPGSSVTITNPVGSVILQGCTNIEIANITFNVMSNFSYILVFEYNCSNIKLSNVTIIGNGYFGCSSVSIESSVVIIANSEFVGINGYLGAALLAVESSINFTKHNSFVSNMAIGGGAVSFNHSNVIFSGTVLFTCNAAQQYNRKELQDVSCKTHVNTYSEFYYLGKGGATFCVNSTIKFLSLEGSRDTTTDFVENRTGRGADDKSMQLCGCKDQVSNSSQDNSIILSHLFGTKFNSCSDTYLCSGICFINNSAIWDGGVMFLRSTHVSFLSVKCVLFHLNRASIFGGSISSHHSSTNFQNFVLFDGNSASIGGALSLIESQLRFCGRVSLVKNSAHQGGAMYTKTSNISFQVNCSYASIHSLTLFEQNKANYTGGSIESYNRGGGALYLIKSQLRFCGSVSLVRNSACRGGAMYTRTSNISFQVNCSYTSVHSLTLFEKNKANYTGGLTVSFNRGGALYLIESQLRFCGSVSLVKNSAFRGGAIFTKKSNISFQVNCSYTSIHSLTLFEQNKVLYIGGSIESYNSHLHFTGDARFYANVADYGGAMILHGTSKLILKPLLSLYFDKNIANKMGGVIYYHDSGITLKAHRNECFISFDTSLENISIIFVNNSANVSGALLHMGQLNSCCGCSRSTVTGCSTLNNCEIQIEQNRTRNVLEILEYISNFKNFTQTNNSNYSSDAQEVIFCSNVQHYLTRKNYSVTLYPGQTFAVALRTVHIAIASTKVSAVPVDRNVENVQLQQNRPRTQINASCANVTFQLFATDIKYQVTVDYKLYHDNPCESLVRGKWLSVSIKPCPLGFQSSREDKKCVCDRRFQLFTGKIKCDIGKLFVERKSNNFWISSQVNSSMLILHRFGCPLDFCKDKLVNVSLTEPYVQCDFNRSGILCGQCRENYSLALGSLHCLRCTSSNYAALILPFATAGIALVMFVLLLHLTVDFGTLNGLIFYMNVVQANRQAYFPSGTVNLCTVFTAWLNLDFGIESCFYEGMDMYVYSWLQFLFPFYIWFLIGTIIVICRYSKNVSKSLGHNPVAVLATLVFISYGKILNAIVIPLSMTQLSLLFKNDTDSTRAVWLYDGSIEFFKTPKHIVLGLFAVLTVLFLFLPYTFLLLCGHRLLVFSDKCFLSWLNKIKPFMDVHYAPYKQETRYWIGLSLLARMGLLLTISINAVGNDGVNVIVITSVTAGLLAVKGRVYERYYNDILESSFILNLCILSVAMFCLKEENIIHNRLILSKASIGIAFVTFIGILLFHIHMLLKSTNLWKSCVIPSIHILLYGLPCKVFRMAPVTNEKASIDQTGMHYSLSSISSTTVNLREPLLDVDII